MTPAPDVKRALDLVATVERPTCPPSGCAPGHDHGAQSSTSAPWTSCSIHGG